MFDFKNIDKFINGDGTIDDGYISISAKKKQMEDIKKFRELRKKLRLEGKGK